MGISKKFQFTKAHVLQLGDTSELLESYNHHVGSYIEKSCSSLVSCHKLTQVSFCVILRVTCVRNLGLYQPTQATQKKVSYQFVTKFVTLLCVTKCVTSCVTPFSLNHHKMSDSCFESHYTQLPNSRFPKILPCHHILKL